MMKKSAALALAAGAVWVLLLLASCKRESRVERAIAEQTLYRAIDVDPADLDPQAVTGIAESKVLTALFEPLVRLDAETLHPVPALAERWEISADGTVYTFHLRANARWSNGEPITAQDCIDTWKRILTPSLAAEYAPQLYYIQGAEAFHKGKGDFAAVGLAAPDAHTLRVTLGQPVPYFLGLLDQPNWAPLNVRAIAAVGDPYRRGTAWTRPEHMVTSGPFVLKTWANGQHILVEKSPTYWNAANVKLHAIDFFPMDSADTQDRSFRAGQLHATDMLPVSKVTSYRGNPALRTDPYLNTYFLRFNVRKPPLDDARVRRALSLAIDREGFTKKVLLAGQQPAAALVPPGLPDYTPPVRPLTDLALARRLLAEAGYSESHPLPPLEIVIPTKGTGPITGEAVQEFWHRDLGLEVSIVQKDQKVLYSDRRAGNYQILLSDWLGDYLDPTTFLELWLSDSLNNHTGWKNADYDALLAQAARTLEPKARAQLLQKAETLMLDAAPIAPIYYNTHVYLLQPSVKGWHPTPLDKLDYQKVWLGK